MTAHTTTIRSAGRRNRPPWIVPTALILLSLIPVIAGAARLTELSGGGLSTPGNARFFDSPVPVVAHILSVTVYSLLGAFQFVPSLRRHRWHRLSGRVLVPAGLIAALSGLWMSFFFDLPAIDGDLLRLLRLIFGTAIVVFIVLGVRAVLHRDYVRHGAWMTRAYAVAVGAGTQALVILSWTLVVGPTDQFTRALLMGASWLINLGVAELAIARRSERRNRSARSTPTTPSTQS